MNKVSDNSLKNSFPRDKYGRRAKLDRLYRSPLIVYPTAFLAPLLPDAWLPSLERLVACALGVTVIYWVYRSQQAFEAWCAHSGSERPVSRVEESASRSRVRHAQRRELKRTGTPAAKGKSASEQALWPPRLQRSDDENPAAELHAFNDDRR